MSIMVIPGMARSKGIPTIMMPMPRQIPAK
jgi:hypothetical protein